MTVFRIDDPAGDRFGNVRILATCASAEFHNLLRKRQGRGYGQGDRDSTDGFSGGVDHKCSGGSGTGDASGGTRRGVTPFYELNGQMTGSDRPLDVRTIVLRSEISKHGATNKPFWVGFRGIPYATP